MTLDDFPPMLLDERPVHFGEQGWVWEPKFDGHRLMAIFGDGRCEMRTRRGAVATHRFPAIARSLAGIRGGPHVVDGELCLMDGSARTGSRDLPMTYCVFDMLVEAGDVVIGDPLLLRKQRLEERLALGLPQVHFVRHAAEGARQLFEQSLNQLGLDGVVAKRADSPYLPGLRSRDWVKVKRKALVPTLMR